MHIGVLLLSITCGSEKTLLAAVTSGRPFLKRERLLRFDEQVQQNLGDLVDIGSEFRQRGIERKLQLDVMAAI